MATPSFTPLFSLPDEIINLVCQQFCPCCSQRTSTRYFFCDGELKLIQDRECLLALSLTCKELRRISQPHLYHRPIGHDFFGFIDTIGRTPTIGQHVRELCADSSMIRSFIHQQHYYVDLLANCNKRYRTHLPDDAQRNPLFRFYTSAGARSLLFFGETAGNAEAAIDCLFSVVISLTPKIKRLEICVHTDRKFWSTPAGHLPNLKQLIITVAKCFPAGNLDSLAGLLDAAPQLESLELAGLDLREAMKESEIAFCHNNVNELILRSSIVHISRLEAIMRGFPKLQTFRIGAPEYWQTLQEAVPYKIEDILMLRSDTLKHITLDFYAHGIDYPVVIQDLSEMKVLETLYINTRMLRRRWQQGVLYTRRICRMLPESIKEFGLMGSACSLVHDEVVDSINISARAFPLLRKVVIDRFGGSHQVDGYVWRRKITSACEASNIEFSTKVPRSSKVLRFPDPDRGIRGGTAS
ncbi:aromatic aminotransferase [Fusarium circinatum]|uniref:Aromatic aminotransferase n=1 Tax=Fusarium circinatum TaxID=48490 RepID=A0A8H5WTC8_FUSCI|nr:aromatic aminotransferase [Fusarium circinatum]